MQNFLGCLSLWLHSKQRQELREFPGFWPKYPELIPPRKLSSLGHPSAGMKGQDEPRGQGGTGIQINQSSWEIPVAPSISPGPAERGREERRSSFPHPLHGAAARPSEGRDINCCHPSVSPGEGTRLGKTPWELGDGKRECRGKEEFRGKGDLGEKRSSGNGGCCVHTHREWWKLGIAHLHFQKNRFWARGMLLFPQKHPHRDGERH